jgi:nucleotide-binding universal stress UspA family protein
MIKDVMVWLDGGLADETRLSAVEAIARQFKSNIIALFFNSMPTPNVAAAASSDVLIQSELLARRIGNQTERRLLDRLERLDRPVEIRRFDVFADDIVDIAAREARVADTFVALRPNGAMDPEGLIESVLFGSGRHLLLVPETEQRGISFDHIMIAWNGSREAARAMAESMPFLHEAKEVTVAVVTNERAPDEEATAGADAIGHLRRHGVEAVVHRSKSRTREYGSALLAAAERTDAHLIVMGGYGHPRLREWLLGGVTYQLMHESPIPILMAH